MSSKTVMTCPRCGTKFTAELETADDYVECPNPDCMLLIDVAQYFTDREQQQQDEADVENDYEEVWYCQICGAGNEGKKIHCDNCGQWYDEHGRPERPPF